MKFLVFGDIVGEIGRRALRAVLPIWQEEHQPQAILANIENMAHGRGISPASFAELSGLGISAYTTGDHAWDHRPGIPLLENAAHHITRPANYPPGAPGRGYAIFSIGAVQIAVLNIQGQVFFKNHPNNPFHSLDELLTVPDVAASHVKLLDFHAEASSEKRAMGYYADGRVTAVWGTHTHVPTADAQILPGGTGYISDIGFTGGFNSIIGMDAQGPLKMFTTQMKERFNPVEQGDFEINALLLTTNPLQEKGFTRTIDIALLRKIMKD